MGRARGKAAAVSAQTDPFATAFGQRRGGHGSSRSDLLRAVDNDDTVGFLHELPLLRPDETDATLAFVHTRQQQTNESAWMLSVARATERHTGPVWQQLNDALDEMLVHTLVDEDTGYSYHATVQALNDSWDRFPRAWKQVQAGFAEHVCSDPNSHPIELLHLMDRLQENEDAGRLAQLAGQQMDTWLTGADVRARQLQYDILATPGRPRESSLYQQAYANLTAQFPEPDALTTAWDVLRQSRGIVTLTSPVVSLGLLKEVQAATSQAEPFLLADCYQGIITENVDLCPAVRDAAAQILAADIDRLPEDTDTRKVEGLFAGIQNALATRAAGPLEGTHAGQDLADALCQRTRRQYEKALRAMLTPAAEADPKTIAIVYRVGFEAQRALSTNLFYKDQFGYRRPGEQAALELELALPKLLKKLPKRTADGQPVIDPDCQPVTGDASEYSQSERDISWSLPAWAKKR